jgi:hypothetical protein
MCLGRRPREMQNARQAEEASGDNPIPIGTLRSNYELRVEVERATQMLFDGQSSRFGEEEYSSRVIAQRRARYGIMLRRRKLLRDKSGGPS